MGRPTQFRVEMLEQRDQPSVFGVAWPNAERLTLSFASDGVKASPIDGYGNFSISELFKELNTAGQPAQWQTEILRAFQTWAAPANINIGLIPDNSTSFGDFEYDFSQSPNGELRIGAVPMTPSVAGLSTPYHLLTGNRAGDVLLNTNLDYSRGGTNGTRDLYTVLLNEAANTLGLDDNTDTSSARYGRYTGVRTGISAADRTAIVNMYGARRNDSLEGASGNSTTATATTLTAVNPPNQPPVFIATADGSIASNTDIDTYRVTTRSDTTQLHVRLQTAGRSLFTGRVEVLTASGQRIADWSNTNPLAGNTTFVVGQIARNTNYFIRVTPARNDVFSVGTYRLQVGLNHDPRLYPQVDPAPFVNFGNDNQTDDRIETAKRLSVTTPGSAANTRFAARGALEGSGDRDLYAVTVPNTGRPLSVTLSPIKSFQITPEVHAYRGNYNWIQPTKLVQSNDGRWVAQFQGLTPGETVYLNVKNIDGTGGTGEYELIADFNTPTVAVRELVSGNTSSWDSSHRVSMSVPESTFFHFGVEAWNDSRFGSGTHVRMSIVNSSGQTVTSFIAGGVDTIQVFLNAGTYSVRFDGVDASGNTRGGAWYRWFGARISDPIDVFDPNDSGNQTPPVVITPTPTAPGDDLSVWFNPDPWSDPIG